MAEAMQRVSIRRPWGRIMMWALIAALLVAPLVAMRFTREVAWGPEDFLFAGALLIGGGLAFELAARTVRSGRLLALIAVGLLTVVVVVWSDAAVGIF